MLEGNSKGASLRRLTHRPTSCGPCTCWECSKDIFNANDKLNEAVFGKLRQKKMRHGEHMIDYASFVEITEGRQSLTDFLTRTIAVLGGLVTLVGLLDGFFFRTGEMLSKKTL